MKDFLTDEEMQALETKTTAPDFISDEEMAKIETPAAPQQEAIPKSTTPQILPPPSPEPQPQDFATTRITAFNEKRPDATPEEIAAYSDALKRAEGVNPELTSMQKIGLSPVGTATEFIGDIPGAIGRTAETAKQQISQIPEKAGRTISDIIFAAGKAKNLVDRASKNVPTAISGLVNMFPAFATQLGRGATDVVASGVDSIGKEELANKIREEGKLAEDTAKQWAGLETNAIRRAAGEPEVDVVGQGIAEELTPEKKQGALAKAMRNKIGHDAANMPEEEFKRKYPEALPIDIFNAKFEQVLADNSLPTTIKSFLVDMPVESVKTIYGAISGDPETWKKFEERPAETIVETGVGLGIGAKTLGELKGVAKNIAGARQKVAMPDVKDFTDTFNKNQQQQTEFLRKQRIEKEMAQRAEQPIAEPKLAQTEVPIPPTEAKPIDKLFQKPQETTEPIIPKDNQQATTDFVTGKTDVKPVVETPQTIDESYNSIPDKKSINKIFQKAKEFLGNEEGSLDMQALYDAITGGKVVKRTPKTTVGDPALQQELLDMYEKGRAIQEKQMTEAIVRRQTTGSAIKQSLLDAYAPLLDKTWEKSTPAEREAIMKSVHDTFYINSNMEGFLREFGDYILKPVKDAGMTYDDYNGVLTARNILEGRKNVKSVWTPEKAQAYLDTIPKDKLDILNKATTEFHEKVWKPILQDLMDNKLADKETIDNIIDNESYAPTFLQKYLELDYGKREHGVNSGIYNLSAEGSTGEMLDPTAMKLQKGMAMIAAGKINKAKYDMAEAMFKAAPQDITEAKKVVKGFREVDDPNNPGQKVKDPKDPTKNLKLPVYEFLEPKGATGLSLVTFRDGKDMRGVYVPKEIAQGFEAATGHAEQLGAAMKFWSAGNQMFRNMWIEYNPFWQVFTNLPKDAMTAAVLFPDLKSKGTLVKNLLKTQSTALMGDFAKFFGGVDRATFEKNKTEMLKRGESMSSLDRQYATEPALDTADRLFKMYGVDGGKRGFLQKVSDFGKDIEAATKMAARMTIEERGLKSKFTPEEQVNIVRRTGSPAFPVRGFGELNSFVKNAFMFFNAMKEGWRAAIYLAKKDPVSAAASAAVPLGLYAFTLAAENGAFGEDAKTAYSKMNKNHKKMNITVPLYYSKNGEINYLTIPMAPFLAPLTDAMRIAVKDNPSLVSSIVSGITNNALPMVNPMLQNIIMLSSADKNNAPVNNFTGQKIMSDNQWRAGGTITTDAFMRQFWNNYMLGSQWRLSVDPFNPNQPQTTISENLFKLVFGKLIRTANETPREGVDEVQRQKARGNLISEQIGYEPSKAKELMKDAKEQGLPISMKTIQNTMKAKKIAGMKTVDADKAALIKAYFSAATREEKMLVMKQIKDRMKKK